MEFTILLFKVQLYIQPVPALGQGAAGRPPRALDIKGRSLIKLNLYLLVNSLKAKKVVIGTTLILFVLINDYFIISFAFFLYGFELQLRGAVEISPRALVVLKPALYPTENGIWNKKLLHNCSETAKMLRAFPGNGRGQITKITYGMVSYREIEKMQTRNY